MLRQRKRRRQREKEAGKEDEGNAAAPVLPKAKAKEHGKKGKGKGKGKSMSPEPKKEWPCVFHYTKEGACLKGKDCPYSHNPKRKHKLDNNTHGGKESAQKGISANTSTLNQRTPKHPLLRLTPSNRPKHRPSPKQQLRQL